MKRVWFMLTLTLTFSVIPIMYGQDDPYSKPVEQKAIKMAHDILNLYYPGNILCITDSIYDHDWFGLGRVIDKETDEAIMSYRIEKKFKYNPTIYSKSLATLFNSDTCQCNKYVADFSAPYKGMIFCYIMPKDRKVGIVGTPTIQSFMFRYDDKGEIYQVTRGLVHCD